MPKIRYSAKENKRVGTHSYYAQGNDGPTPDPNEGGENEE